MKLNIWKKLLEKKRRSRGRTDLISLYKDHTPKFHKRRKRVIGELLRRIRIPLSKHNIIIYCLIIGFCGLVWVFVLLSGPFFEIKEIYITRQNTNVNIDIAYRAVDSFRGKKSYLLDTDTIESAILKNQESIKNISTSLRFPDNIEIDILSYEWVFQTYLNDDPYTILENGTVIPLSGSSELPYVIVYLDSDDIPSIPDYKKTFDPKYIESITFLKNSLIENIVELQIANLHYYLDERELIIELVSGGDIIFDLTWDLAWQIERVAIFHEESANIPEIKLIYIDARIPNKLFTCGRDSEFLCRLNLKNTYGERIELPTESEESIEQ